MATAFACALGLLIVVATINTLAADSSASQSDWAALTLGCFGGFGFLAGLVCGVGVSTTDMQPASSTSGDHAPLISINGSGQGSASGFGTLAIAFGLPILGGTAIVNQDELPPGLVAWLLAATVLPYTAAVLAGLVLRHAIYSALIGFLLTMACWSAVGEHFDETIGLVAVATACLAMTFLAWLSARHDWRLAA